MVLTLNEKEKLLEKAKTLSDKIKEINIRDNISVYVEPKYFPRDSRYAHRGFEYWYNSKTLYIFAENITKGIKELEEGITKLKNKEYSYISEYTINALLDFIYYENHIVENIERQNKTTREELNNLLS